MKWTDAAIIISARKYGENSALVRVLAREHGLFSGVVRGATSAKMRGILQAGNGVSAAWQARLSQQLGTFKIELLEAHTAYIMNDAAKLSALSSACALIEMGFPERHPYPNLFTAFHEFLQILSTNDHWLYDYINLELNILSESGFGLDFSECAATGRTDNLIYVSPKSGRAVCAEAGEPYKEKLLPLPAFLRPLILRPLPNPPPQAGEGTRKSNLIKYAKELRANQTEAEKRLWLHLRAHRFENYGFRRQYPIDEKYIEDFVCLEKKLIIELDGGHHAEQIEYDQMRTEFLEEKGFNVIRFWNNEVMENLEGVLTLISERLNKSPSLTLPRKREREQENPLSPQGGGLGRGRHKEILAGMELTGYFLEHWMLAPHGKKLPAIRARLIGTIRN